MSDSVPATRNGSVPIERETLVRLARSARLALTDEELDVLGDQLNVILDAFARISEVATDDVPPMTHAVSRVNVTRRDVLVQCLPRDDVLAAAPSVEDHKFRVPRILSDQP